MATRKATMTVNFIIDVDIDKKEAYRLYPDCLWPEEAFARDLILEHGADKYIESCDGLEVKDIIFND